MIKYINANELKLILNREHLNYSQMIEKKFVLNVIDEMPSADVRENKHGEWQEVKRWECTTHSVTDMKCSVCHHYASLVLPHQTTCTYDFCPFCGADMRERKERKVKKCFDIQVEVAKRLLEDIERKETDD